MASPLARADQDQDQPLMPPQSAMEREKKHEAAAVITHATSATVKGRFSMRARYTPVLAAVAMTAAFIGAPTVVYAVDWHSGTGASCSVACNSHGGAVSSGIFNGDPAHTFFVCRTNVEKQGARAGYNLNAAYGASKCVVGFGGRELPAANYSCLCNN
jgi:hypothetical protein